MTYPGLLITFEGGEGAGKTTLIERLYEALQTQGVPALKTYAPGGTQVGAEIRQLLLHTKKGSLSMRCELLLYLADRAQHTEELLLPALKQGKIILCDRFHDSTLAYQGVARGFSRPFVKELCSFAAQGLQPDLTLYLDLDPEVGFQRTTRAGKIKDRIESEELSFHHKIRSAFKEIAQEEPSRFLLLDASKSPQDVFLFAKEKIDALISARR